MAGTQGMLRVARNTSAVGAAFVTGTLLSFLQIKLLTRYLTQDELGEYSTCFALGAILSVLAQIGLPVVVMRFTAKYDALAARVRIRRLVGFALALTAALAVLVLALVWLLAPAALPRLYREPPAAGSVLLATAVWLATALRQVVYAAFDGLRRMRTPALLESLNVALVTAAILAVGARLDVPLVLGLSLGSGLLAFAVALFLLRRLPDFRLAALAPAAPAPAAPALVTPLIPEIAPFWWGAALNAIIGIGFGYADKLLVSLFLSFQMVSLFFVAERVTFLLKRLLAVPLQVASPEMTHRWESGRREELSREVGFLLKLQFALGLLVTGVVFVAAEAAVLIVASPAFLAAAGLLRTLTLSVMLMAFYAPITALLRAIERIDLALLSDVIWLGLYVGLGMLLMPRLGLQGIVLAQVAASAATLVWNVAAGQRAVHITWDVAGMVRVALCGLVTAAVGYVVARALGTASGPFAQLLVAAASGAVYLVLLWWSGAFQHSERTRLLSLAGLRASRHQV
jgi:polysaccharide transporter, PST family